MSLINAWIVTGKEFSILRKQKGLLITIFYIPIFLGAGLPLVVWYRFINKSHGLQIFRAIPFINSFEFFFVILSILICLILASYSIVSEKTQKSLEPLLATPLTDGEILLGKALSAFIPAILAIYAGATIFITLIDKFTFPGLGYLYYPNLSLAIVLLILVPLGIGYAVELSTIVSSKANDYRSAYQISAISLVPFFIMYVLGELGIFTFTIDHLLFIAAGLLIVDSMLVFLALSIFKREEILTRWK